MIEEDRNLEASLQRFLPAGPPHKLRQRVLAAACQNPSKTGHRWTVSIALAAMLALAAYLKMDADAVMNRTMAGVGSAPMQWTAQTAAREIARVERESMAMATQSRPIE